MAGVSHLRTKKEAERREKIDHVNNFDMIISHAHSILFKIFGKCCSDGESLEISRFIDYLASVDVELEDKDIKRLSSTNFKSKLILMKLITDLKESQVNQVILKGKTSEMFSKGLTNQFSSSIRQLI